MLAHRATGFQQGGDFFARQDLQLSGLGLAPRDREVVLFALARAAIQEVQRRGGIVGGRPGEFAFFDQVQQIALNLFYCQRFR